MVKITIECNGVTSKVLLNGKNISKEAAAVSFTHVAGEVPQVQLTYSVDEAKVVGSCVNNTAKQIGFETEGAK